MTRLDTGGAVQRRTVRVLATAQVLGGLGVGAGVTVGGLLAASLGDSESWAGIAQTAGVLGTAVVAAPLARFMDARGRRPGLTAGLLAAAVGAALVLVAAAARWLPLLLVGTFLVGAASASGLQARYAATDLAVPEHRARALSLVVWATTVGAVLGPNLAEPAGAAAMAVGLPQLSGGYLVTLAAFVAAAATVWLLLRPDPLLLARSGHEPEAGGSPIASERVRLRESLGAVRRSPGATLGLLAITIAHTTMVAVMVMTPVHMRHVDVALTVVGLVVSVHILGMYVLSPLVGIAADRFGRVPVITVGAAVLLVSCVVAGVAPADDAVRLGIGLFLLGLGWSCCLVAGSALLSESVPEAVRVPVQGAADTAMYAAGAVGGAAAGVIVAVWSYGWLCVAAGVLAAVLLAAVGVARRRRRQVAEGHGDDRPQDGVSVRALEQPFDVG